MELHQQLVARAGRDVRVASGVAALFGTVSLLVALLTWSDRGYIDYQIIFGIADALAVLALAGWLRAMRAPAAVLLIILGVAGIGYAVREGAPFIAAVPTLIGIGFYARALSALKYLDTVNDRDPAGKGTLEEA